VRGKSKIKGEKVEEWEVKGNGFWPFPYPLLSLFPPSISFPMGIFSKERRMHKSINYIVTRDYQNEEIEPHSKLVFPIGFPG
jgi:hypothetical protein